jgi:CHAT domain-containing protein
MSRATIASIEWIDNLYDFFPFYFKTSYRRYRAAPRSNLTFSALHSIVFLVVLTSRTWAVNSPNDVPLAIPAAANANAIIIAQAERRAAAAQTRNDIPALVQALNDEADAQLRDHNFDAAEKLRLQVLHLQEEHAGKNSLVVSDALLNLGWFYGNMARYEAAQEALDRCQFIRLKLLGPDAAPLAEVLNALGVLEENRSNLSLAEAFYEQAVAIQEKALGPQSPVTANTWNNLATLYWIMGDYAGAQKYFEQALAVREKAFGPDSAVVAKTLNNLALLDSSLGDYDGAEDYFQRALKIRASRLGPDNLEAATTLSQLGLLYVRREEDARAEPLLVQAIATEEKISEEDGPDLARSLMELAMLYDRRKQFDKAEPLLRRSLELRRRILGDEHPEYAASLAALARHDHAQGKLAEAEPLYEQALKIDQEALGENHPDTLAVAENLAFLKIERRQPSDAMQLAHDVSGAQQNVLNGVFTFAPERQRMEFERTVSPCDLPAALADADLLAETVLRTKDVVLDSLLEDEAATRAMGDPGVRDLLERRRLIEAQLGQMSGEGVTLPNSPALLAERQSLEQQERQIESDLTAKGVVSGETRRALGTDVSDVRGAIPEDAALIEYVAYNRYAGRLNFEAAYGAIVLTRDGPIQWVPLGTAADIDARVHLDQKYMRKRVHDPVLAEALHGLQQALLQPVLGVLPAGIHRLIISPDDNLNFISFATLLDDANRFVADDFEVDYVASGRDLLDENGPGSPTLKKHFAIFADPDYDGTSASPRRKARVAPDDGPFPPLPGTKREAELIAVEATKVGLACEQFGGAFATKANLLQAHSPYVLHFATHGLYLSPDDLPVLPPVTGDATKSALVQPMARSLLALAGASVTLRDWKRGVFPPAESDGLLTAQQAAALDLDHTWLVTLSACDTGTGEAEIGEGVLGLRRGFAEAGARNLLVTLWTADDLETADFMAAFYHDALKSGDAPGALARVQQASLDRLRKTSGLSEAVRKAGPFVLSY